MKFLLVVVFFTVLQQSGGPKVPIPELERRVHELINKERTKKKLEALRFDEQLSRIARAHSADMAKRRFFGHVNPDGKNASDRARREGYACQKVYAGGYADGLAENIYQGNLYSQIRIIGNQRSYDWYSFEQLAEDPVEGWMDSDGHRRNILEKNYDREGIGIAIDADGKVFVTEVFC